MERWPESASSAKALQVLIVGGGSGGSSSRAQLLRGSRGWNLAHPGAAAAVHEVTSPAGSRLELVCWRRRRPTFRGQRDPRLGLSGFRAAPASFEPQARRVNHGPPRTLSYDVLVVAMGSPKLNWSQIRAAGGTRQLRHHQHTTHAPTSRPPGRRIRSFRVVRLFSATPANPINAAVAPQKVECIWPMTSSQAPAGGP